MEPISELTPYNRIMQDFEYKQAMKKHKLKLEEFKVTINKIQ